jgi:hypothetical protein
MFLGILASKKSSVSNKSTPVPKQKTGTESPTPSSDKKLKAAPSGASLTSVDSGFLQSESSQNLGACKYASSLNKSDKNILILYYSHVSDGS